MDFRQNLKTEKLDRATLGKRQTTGTFTSRVLPRKDTDNLRRQRPAPPAVPSTSSFTNTVSAPKFSATRTLHQDNSRVNLTERPSIQKCKQELRPLLNSIRTVESRLKRNSSERITDINIGPFQISRQYHEDAWKNGSSIVSNGSSWYRCRDSNHAESTVISYWIKFCPEAVEKRDFETLAKVHHAGLQGLHMDDAEEYWSKIRLHLRQPKETVQSEIYPNKTDAKPEKTTSRVLLPLTTNTASNRSQKSSSRKTERGGAALKQPSFAKQKVQKDNSWAPDKLDDRQTPSKSSRHNLKHTTIRRKDMDIRAMCNKLEEIVFRKSGIHFQHVASGFNEAFSTLSQEFKRDKAALKIQSFWQMRRMRHQYLRMKNAARVLQNRWRQYMSRKSATYSCIQEEKTPKYIPTKQAKPQNIRYPIDYPYQVLYEGSISPMQEEALLTELAGLLICDKRDAQNESCFTFQLPCSNDSDEEGSTPKMRSPTASPDLFDCHRSFGEDTNTENKLTILSPVMEHATSELVKLFPQFSYSVSNDSLQSSFNYEDRYFNSSHLIYHGRVSKNDEIIKKLRFSSSMDEICWGNDAEKILDHDDKEIPVGSSCPNDNNETELEHVPIPLLIDQSPMVVQKNSKKRDRNPCNRKVEKALVSSLSEWQVLDSSVESIQNQTSGSYMNFNSVRTSRKFCSARKLNPRIM